MTQQLIAVDGSTWRFAPDTALPFASNPQPLLFADAIDEITGAPPDVPLSVTTDSSGLMGRAALGGRVGLVGRPLSLFSTNFVAGAMLDMMLAAEGFLPLALAGVLGPQPNYPSDFTPVNLGTVFLHRSPTRINGRTVSHDHTVRPSTAVTINGIWSTQSQLLGAPAAANLIAITPGLYADRPAAASVRQFNVTPVLAQAKQLIGPFSAGATQIRVRDTIGLVPGSLLIIDWPDKDRSEIIAVTAIVNPGTGTDEPATAVLAHVLQHSHRDGTLVYPASAGAAGAANSLARVAQIGDVTVFPGTMLGLNITMASVEITGGAASAEYHWARTYQITSDADGYFQLPPVHRLAQIQLHATNGAEPQPLDLPITLDWGREALLIDLVFPVP
jgi:hypothetical protein